MNFRRVWEEWFGRSCTRRWQRRIIPHLIWNQQIWGETVKAYMTSAVRYLDAGCGYRPLGKDLEALENEMVSLPRVAVGVDLDLPHLRKHVNLSRKLQASLDSLPFPDGAFDLITCNMVVEHLPAPLVTFRELSRVLAPNGVLMVHTPNRRNYLVLANIIAKTLLQRSLVLKLVRDGRSSDDIYPTYYRANRISTLHDLGRSVSLEPELVRCLTHPRPFTRFFAPLALFELMLMRFLMKPLLQPFATTIVMAFRKGPAQSASLRTAA